MIETSPAALFQLANTSALAGWIWLLIWMYLPEAAHNRLRYAGLILPLMLAVLYAGSMLVHFSTANGGFDTLANVMALFTEPGMVLAGWVHYLAFDLFVGWCIVHDARQHKFNRLIIIPCLLFTFMLGPVGLLLYAAIRLAHQFANSPAGETS